MTFTVPWNATGLSHIVSVAHDSVVFLSGVSVHPKTSSVRKRGVVLLLLPGQPHSCYHHRDRGHLPFSRHQQGAFGFSRTRWVFSLYVRSWSLSTAVHRSHFKRGRVWLFFFMISSYFGWKLLRPHHNRDPTAKSPSNRPLKATEGSLCDSCLIYCHLDGIFFLFLVKFINFVFAFPELNQISSLSHLLYVIWMSSSKPLSTHLSKYIKHSLMNGDTN